MSRPAANRNGRAVKPYDRPRPRVSDGMWVHDKAPGVPASVVNSTNNARNGPNHNNKLVVSNLHYNVSPKDLIAIFGQIGTLVREPVIKYDRSGRSTGTAFITYETPVEATRAKNQFNGIMAKGQPMTVGYDNAPRLGGRGVARRVVSAPTSLMDRISKPPLLDRLASDAPPAPSVPTGPRKSQAIQAPKAQAGETGPIRTRTRRRGGARAEKVSKEPKTAEELDKELDAFMGDDDVVKTTEATSAPMEAGAETEADVEMAS